MIDETYEYLQKLSLQKNDKKTKKILISEPVYDMLNIFEYQNDFEYLPKYYYRLMELNE